MSKKKAPLKRAAAPARTRASTKKPDLLNDIRTRLIEGGFADDDTPESWDSIAPAIKKALVDRETLAGSQCDFADALGCEIDEIAEHMPQAQEIESLRELEQMTRRVLQRFGRMPVGDYSAVDTLNALRLVIHG